MGRVSVCGSKDHFIRDGKPFFYLADTAWMAILNLSVDEFEHYLDYRARQGFTAIQLNLLASLHDTSSAEGSAFGFDMKDGVPDFDRINPAYFDKAEQIIRMVYERGLVPVLFPLWVNFVPDTWAAARVGEAFTMSMEQMKRYMEYCVKRFDQYEPIYSVSGDTWFETQRVCDYYIEALRIVKSLSPGTLTTMHLAPSGELMPDVFMQSPDLDFIMYQSSHDHMQNDNPHAFAQMYYHAGGAKRPIVNGEPCYEGHGHANVRERFDAFEVRMATWQSLLSGAKAGVTYGAHGIWSFHNKRMSFTSEGFSGKPFLWEDALRFPGAWDAAFARWIFETFGLHGIRPVDKVLNDTQNIRMARDDKHVLIYAPYAFDVVVDEDLGGYDVSMWVLAERRVARPELVVESGRSTVRMHGFNSDVLIIGTKR